MKSLFLIDLTVPRSGRERRYRFSPLNMHIRKQRSSHYVSISFPRRKPVHRFPPWKSHKRRDAVHHPYYMHERIDRLIAIDSSRCLSG